MCTFLYRCYTCGSTALTLLFKSVALINIQKKISMNAGAYSLRLSIINRGLEMTIAGLSDQNIIKYLTTVLMKCKFPSLTLIVLLYLSGRLLHQLRKFSGCLGLAMRL